MKQIFSSFAFAIFIFFGIIGAFPGSVHAGVATCSDGTTGCGIVTSYNMGIESCSLVGPDISGGNRILGGEVCSIGGSDNPGFSMSGTNEPSNSTSYFANSGSMPPGWNYIKSAFSHSTIPSGEFQDDPYYNIRFFGGSASMMLYSSDDESSLQVGSNNMHWTGCTALVTDVTKSGCPSSTLVGTSAITANPGDAITFSVTNRLRPNNGTATWGSGSANITLSSATECYTSAYFNTIGGRYPAGTPIVSYHPTAAGVCTPDVVPSSCIINSFQATPTAIVTGGTPSSSSLVWDVTPNGNTITIDNGIGAETFAAGNTSVSPTANTTYTLTCGNKTLTATVTVTKAASVARPAIGLDVPTSVSVPANTDSVPVTVTFWNAGDVGSTLNITGCAIADKSTGLRTGTFVCSGTFTN